MGSRKRFLGRCAVCQLTANVLLRQFWPAVDHPVEETQTLGGPTLLLQITGKGDAHIVVFDKDA